MESLLSNQKRVSHQNPYDIGPNKILRHFLRDLGLKLELVILLRGIVVFSARDFHHLLRNQASMYINGFHCILLSPSFPVR
jgi:hypothetical protein